MIKTCFALAAALALSAFALPAAATTQLTDGGVEVQGAPVSTYCYFGLDCANGGPWTGANGGGIQDETNGAWPGTPTPDGSKYLFVQNEGYVEQTFTATDSGTYDLSYLVSGRAAGCCQGNQSYVITLDDLTISAGATVTGQAFTPMTSTTFSMLSGSTHTLRIQGLSPGPDNTVNFDGLSMQSAVPEPASWALMIGGFFGLGAVLRTRRRQLMLAA